MQYKEDENMFQVRRHYSVVMLLFFYSFAWNMEKPVSVLKQKIKNIIKVAEQEKEEKETIFSLRIADKAN